MKIEYACKRCSWTRVAQVENLDTWEGEDMPPKCPACGGIVEARITSQGAFR